MLQRTGPSTVKSRVTRCGWGQGKLFLLLATPKSAPAATFIAPVLVQILSWMALPQSRVP